MKLFFVFEDIVNIVNIVHSISPSLYTCVSVNTSLSVSYKNYNIASLGLNSKTLGFILALGISFVNYI